MKNNNYNGAIKFFITCIVLVGISLVIMYFDKYTLLNLFNLSIFILIVAAFYLFLTIISLIGAHKRKKKREKKIKKARLKSKLEKIKNGLSVGKKFNAHKKPRPNRIGRGIKIKKIDRLIKFLLTIIVFIAMIYYILVRYLGLSIIIK